MGSLTQEEMEFSIYGNAAERNVLHAFSDDPYWQRRFEAAGATLVRTDGDSRFYTLRLDQVLIRAGKAKRAMSDERKAQLADRMRALRRNTVNSHSANPKTAIVETGGAQ